MVAGMGGLSQGFIDLAEGQDRAQMMSPQAIMGNLEHGNMLMGPNMRPAITGGPSNQMIQQQKPPSAGGSGLGMMGVSGSGMMVQGGGKLKSVGQ